MTVTANSIKSKFPEFKSLSDTTIEFAIEDARTHVDETTAGTAYDHLISWGTAHYLMLSTTSAAITGEPVAKSESVGPITVSYDTSAPRAAMSGNPEDFWLSTPYGQRYLQLMNLINPAVFVV